VSDEGEETATDHSGGEATVTERADDDAAGVDDVVEAVGLADEHRATERAAESFLDLEAELSDGAPVEGTWGRAVDVEVVSGETVPDDYPVEIATGEALSLRLAVGGGREVAAYFEWDDGTPGEGLERLLALHDVPADRFAELHGKSILLRAEAGHHVPYLPEEAPRGSPNGVYGVAAGLGGNLLTVLLLLVGLGGALSSAPVVLAWLALNLIGLPAATYLDAWDLRTSTDWEGGPLFWAFLAMIPGVNIASTLAYLYARRSANPVA